MFIRTKDGIYDFEEQRGNIENRGEKSFLAIGNDYRGCTCYDYEEIIQEADTIAELCDEFLIMDNGRCMEIFSNYDNLKSSGWYRSDIDIYGAIYTDKGLIYVAKMNDEGKLCLL